MLSSALLASLEALDSDWQLIPCDDRKRPIDPATGHCRQDWAARATDLEGFLELAGSAHVKAVGLVLGPASGVMAIDFDGAGSTATFQEVFGRPCSDLPPTVAWSSGRPNRRQLAFRVPFDYWSHLRGRRFWKRNGSTVLELRWAGHQSVIAGAHPDTAGYHWIPGRSPAEVRVADAPDWLIEPLYKAASEATANDYQPTAADGERALQLLRHIQPREDYNSWLAIGMALHSVDPALLGSWVEWSRGCRNFDEEECLRKWASFKGRGVTIGTLYFFAEQDGFLLAEAEEEPFVWQPPADQSGPEGTVDPGGNARSEDLEMARERLAQQLADLEADIDLWTVLPPLLTQALFAKAETMGVHPTAFLGPLLTTAASVVGTRARVRVNAGWTEPFVIWAGNILPPSAMKSAILDVISQPLMGFQLRDFKRHQQDHRQARQGGEDPETIAPPRRWLVMDATYERVAQIVAEPRTIGLLSAQDELMGWFERLDARTSAGARSGWLSLWSGSPALVDRKVAASSIAPRSAVSLFGNVQPDRFLNMILATEEDTAAAGDGLWARFLWCRPPQKPWRYSPHGVSIAHPIQQLLSALDTIPTPSDHPLADGAEPQAMEVRIPQEVALALAAPQWEQWAAAAAACSNPARAAFLGKLRGYSVRLAGLLFLVELAEGVVQTGKPLSSCCQIDAMTGGWYVEAPAASMTAALTLATFYLHQFDALQAELGSSELPPQVARFLRKVDESGKTSVSPRDVITWRIFGRSSVTSADALRFLRQLVEVYGHGVMVQGQRKGSMVWHRPNC